VTALDASAVLALIHNEPGADRVAEALDGGVLATVNLAEVVDKLADTNVRPAPRPADSLAHRGIGDPTPPSGASAIVERFCERRPEPGESVETRTQGKQAEPACCPRKTAPTAPRDQPRELADAA
jgi:uncharacterized protein with PIN domain